MAGQALKKQATRLIGIRSIRAFPEPMSSPPAVLVGQQVVYTQQDLPVWLRDQLVNVLHTIPEDSFWASMGWSEQDGLSWPGSLLAPPRVTINNTCDALKGRDKKSAASGRRVSFCSYRATVSHCPEPGAAFAFAPLRRTLPRADLFGPFRPKNWARSR